MKKQIKSILKYLLVGLLICIIIFIWISLPIVSGYEAKTLCSDVFISGRNPTDVIKKELSSFPSNLCSYSIDMKDSSVSASVFGLARKKAIFRRGLGATLINGISENELLKQHINFALSPSVNQDTIDWPQGNRINNALSKNVNNKQLNFALNKAFEDPGKGTRAIVIVYDGQIIAEKYADGYSTTTKQCGFSMTKSIMNALIGIIVKQGRLNIDSPASVSQWKNDERKQITITNLMQMSSGLHWWEFPFGPSQFTIMLFKEKDMAQYALDASLKNKPGSKFNYSSGSPAILSYIIRNTLGDSNYYNFPYEELFYKIGMLNTVMEVDPSGTFVGSTYCYATARDWARFGLLYLNDGVWNNERILPVGWVKFTTTPSAAKTNIKLGEYGALWWINAAGNYPSVPKDCFFCQGYFGQYVWVIPSKKLVVVRLSFEQSATLDTNIFLSTIINALPS